MTFSHLKSATRAAQEAARVAQLTFVEGCLLLARARLLYGRRVGECDADGGVEGMEEGEGA